MHRRSYPDHKTVVTAIVERNGLFRDGLVEILQTSRFNVVLSAPAIDADAITVIRENKPDLLVIDLGPDLLDTLSQIKLFKSFCTDSPVAVLAPSLDSDLASLFHEGASAFLSSSMRGEALIKALELVMLGETVLPQQLLSALLVNSKRSIPTASPKLQTEPLANELKRGIDSLAVAGDRGPHNTVMKNDATPQFSDQERRILRCLVEGDSNKSIARKIGIAEATVKV
jgi:two-component system nitrate/nitrite response regulator NarL